MGDKGVLTLEPLNLKLEFMLPFMVTVELLDFGVQSSVIEFPGVSHQIVEFFGGTYEELMIPYQHGFD